MSGAILILVLLINLRILSSNRMYACIDLVATQGSLLAVYALSAHWDRVDLELVSLALFTLILKGIYFPYVLHRAIREVHSLRETAPFVGYIASLAIGLSALAICQWLGSRLPLPDKGISTLAMPAALFCVFSGLFMIVARKKIVLQAVGYLLIDSGIFTIGISAFPQTSLLVELGLLINMCVAVFARGIIIYNLSRVFHHMDSHQLSTLKG